MLRITTYIISLQQFRWQPFCSRWYLGRLSHRCKILIIFFLSTRKYHFNNGCATHDRCKKSLWAKKMNKTNYDLLETKADWQKVSYKYMTIYVWFYYFVQASVFYIISFEVFVSALLLNKSLDNSSLFFRSITWEFVSSCLVFNLMF